MGEHWPRVSLGEPESPLASRSLSGLDPQQAQDRELLLSALSSLHTNPIFGKGNYTFIQTEADDQEKCRKDICFRFPIWDFLPA